MQPNALAPGQSCNMNILEQPISLCMQWGPSCVHPPVAVQHGAQRRLIRRLQLHRQLQRRAVFTRSLGMRTALEAGIARLQNAKVTLV